MLIFVYEKWINAFYESMCALDLLCVPSQLSFHNITLSWISGFNNGQLANSLDPALAG